jgi:hypothetical protein
MPPTGKSAKEPYIVRKLFRLTVHVRVETLLHGETVDEAGIFSKKNYRSDCQIAPAGHFPGKDSPGYGCWRGYRYISRDRLHNTVVHHSRSSAQAESAGHPAGQLSGVSTSNCASDPIFPVRRLAVRRRPVASVGFATDFDVQNRSLGHHPTAVGHDPACDRGVESHLPADSDRFVLSAEASFKKDKIKEGKLAIRLARP